MQAKPLAIGETLAWPTPDRRFVIKVQNTGHSYAVSVENGSGFRVDELARTEPTESDARALARKMAEMLRDGATVEQVVAAIQPAADVIAAAEQLLHDAVLAADVAKLSRPQRDAIAAAKNGHIVRGQVSTVKTLYALEAAHLGVCVRRGYTPVRLELNGRGMQIRDYLTANRNPIAA